MADDKLTNNNISRPSPKHGVPEQFNTYKNRHNNVKRNYVDGIVGVEPTLEDNDGFWDNVAGYWRGYWSQWDDIFSNRKTEGTSASERWNMDNPTGEDVGIFPFLVKKKNTTEKQSAKEEVVLDRFEETILDDNIPIVELKPQSTKQSEVKKELPPIELEDVFPAHIEHEEAPYDPRIFRNSAYIEQGHIGKNTLDFNERRAPYSYESAQTRIKEFTPFILDDDSKDTMEAKYKRTAEIAQELIGDGNAWGVQSIMNPYAQVSLYNGLSVVKDNGNYKVDRVSLLDKRGRKKFYDINSNVPEDVTSISTPTTTNIIKFGNIDGFGRTPYSYQDFVFCKYWNKIPNNRMITLRRFPLPTLDNLNFPGMTEGNRLFAPISTAVTYFGGESDNKLSSLLSFSVGFNWGDLSGNVHDIDNSGGDGTGVSHLSNLLGDNKASKLYTSMLKTLSFFGDEDNPNTLNREAIISVPDPYENGPLENKLKGPVNVINKVKQRKTGLEYKNNITLTFDYVARPIGGINTKAAMLDILANMLVMSYANGLFWGGSYRFMTNPNLYPLKGFNDVAKKLYAGDFEGAAADMIYNVKDSVSGMANVMNQFLDSDIFGAVRNAFTSLLNGDMGQAWSSIKDATPDNLRKNISNYFTAKLAKKTGIENITGMKALLTGDPVGDWHLTIGNPLNPIAVIGNLIVTNTEITFGDELGPDDFPLEMKVKISLEHGMGRDKSAIESMFNRGHGRIYTLPDYADKSSADGETKVDDYTGAGTKPAGEYTAEQINQMGMYGKFANRHRGKIEHSQTKIVNADKSILQIPKYTPSNVDNLYTEFESMENSVLGRYYDYQDKNAAWIGEKTVN